MTGVVAKKAGFLALLGVFLVKAGKFLLLGLAFIPAFFKKFFTKKDHKISDEQNQ